MKYVWFILLVFMSTSSTAQYSLDDILGMMKSGDLKQAYGELNKYNSQQIQEDANTYYFLKVGVCKQLFNENKTLNSSYRIEGLRAADYLLESGDSTYNKMSKKYLRHFLASYYKDLIPIYNRYRVDEKKGESGNKLYLIGWSDETVETAALLLKYNYVKGAGAIFEMGAFFYNQGMVVLDNKDPKNRIDKKTKRDALANAYFNAATPFLQTACDLSNGPCKMMQRIEDSQGGN